jgi:hypothetical protein|tara:strand:- start:335 stop:616 length:282 start_codon:yes stop_codon:yes gene_type:complete
VALTDRTGREIANEHPKYATIKKDVVEKVRLADISQKDIDATKMKNYSGVDLDNAKMISGNDSLTQKELTKLKKALKDKATSTLETTGKFKKD